MRKAAVTTYTVLARREGQWWILTVPELDVVTQARRLDLAEPTVRGLIGTWLDVPPDSFVVEVTPELPDRVRTSVTKARDLRRRAEDMVATAAAASRAVVVDLTERGLSVRDVGVILGISPQPVSQLQASGRSVGAVAPRKKAVKASTTTATAAKRGKPRSTTEKPTTTARATRATRRAQPARDGAKGAH
jgi:predicted transcriptional regulator